MNAELAALATTPIAGGDLTPTQTVQQATFLGNLVNAVRAYGGAIAVGPGVTNVAIQSSVILFNVAVGKLPGGGFGGGIARTNDVLFALRSTLLNLNYATQAGSNVFVGW